MKNIIKNVITCLLLICPVSLHAQQTARIMSLNELFSLADTQSKTIKIYESVVSGAEKDISVAKNAYLPSVEFSATATHGWPTATFQTDIHFHRLILATTSQ